MRIIVFEDYAARGFEPLALTRGVFDLRLGLFTLAERVKHFMQVEQVDFLARSHIAEHIRLGKRARANEPEAVDDEALFVNGLLVFNGELRSIAQRIRLETVVAREGRIVLARFSESRAREVAALLMDAPGVEASRRVLEKAFEKIEYEGDALLTSPWEIVERNSLQIIDDYETMPRLRLRIPPEATLIGRRRNVYVGRDTEIDPYVTLDTVNGPIYVGEGCEIRAGSFIEGPAYIGPGTVIHPSTVIRGGSNIGPACRIGGEVEATIIHGYVDKQHAGFLGHAYVGEWVELGPLFANSGGRIGTGAPGFGGVISDHVEASAGTIIHHAGSIGVASRVSGHVWGSVPSFVFYEASGQPVCEVSVEEVLKTARKKASLREAEFTPADEQLLKRVFELTRGGRMMLKPCGAPRLPD